MEGLDKRNTIRTTGASTKSMHRKCAEHWRRRANPRGFALPQNEYSNCGPQHCSVDSPLVEECGYTSSPNVQ